MTVFDKPTQRPFWIERIAQPPMEDQARFLVVLHQADIVQVPIRIDIAETWRDIDAVRIHCEVETAGIGLHRVEMGRRMDRD